MIKIYQTVSFVQKKCNTVKQGLNNTNSLVTPIHGLLV
jgi:hypothetical protein